jgi:hypothetical protein
MGNIADIVGLVDLHDVRAFPAAVSAGSHQPQNPAHAPPQVKRQTRNLPGWRAHPSILSRSLADRTNASVDLFNPKDDTFIGRVGGFKGVVVGNGVANSNLSGPDGVLVTADNQVWAGDGDSTVKVIYIGTRKVVDTISTGGKFRCDEMSWDSADHILAVANNADTPPFLTLINTDTHQVLKKITFDGTNGTPDATNGLEQSQWSPTTGMFYVSVPQVGADVAQGGVSVIDPSSMSVVATHPVQIARRRAWRWGRLIRRCSGAVPPSGPARTF